MVQCVIEAFADEDVFAVSDNFRGFIYIAVAMNFLTAYIGAEFSIPSKIYYALIGFVVYIMYVLLVRVMGEANVPDFL